MKIEDYISYALGICIVIILGAYAFDVGLGDGGLFPAVMGWMRFILPLVVIANVLYHGFNSMYTIVPSQQAHIVVSARGRKAFMSRDEHSPQYWRIPVLQKVNILPLEQIKIEINDVSLHDTNMAPFVCDIVCWVVIDDAIKASERIGDVMGDGTTDVHSVSQAFAAVKEDVSALISSTARTAAMEMELLDLMRDRMKFSVAVEKNMDISLAKWGLNLTDLEILHIKDYKTYTVITDYEAMRAQEIETKSRIDVADNKNLADVAESNKERNTKTKQAENLEKYRNREIIAQQEISIKEQKAEMNIQEQVQKANLQKVEAEKTLAVGQAEYLADASVKTAEGERAAMVERAEGAKDKRLLEAEAEAKYAQQTAEAEAAGNKAKLLAVAEGEKAKLLAEATGKDKLAEALKKYEDAAMGIVMVDAAKDILIEQAKQTGTALAAANLSIIRGGGDGDQGGGLLGGLIGADGADIATILGGLKNSLNAMGIDTSRIFPSLKKEKEGTKST